MYYFFISYNMDMKKLKINIFIFIIVFCIFLSFYFIYIINKKALPVFSNHVENKINNYVSNVINTSIKSIIDSDIDNDKIFNMVQKENGDIVTIDFNSYYVNDILTSINKKILNNLGDNIKLDNSNDDFSKYIIENNNVYNIPLGVVTNSVFLSNFGPKIPLKFNVIGNVMSNVLTNVKEYGINNVLLEVSINIDVDMEMLIPFESKKINISTNVPVIMKIIQGNIPKYYGGSLMKESNILSFPMEMEEN